MATHPAVVWWAGASASASGEVGTVSFITPSPGSIVSLNNEISEQSTLATTQSGMTQAGPARHINLRTVD
jgi:hypothetical protein